MPRHKNKITRLYYRLPYTYALSLRSEILCTQATELFNHFKLRFKYIFTFGRSIHNLAEIGLRPNLLLHAYRRALLPERLEQAMKWKE